jgi:DNA-binding NarL/FixJ family response regulator
LKTCIPEKIENIQKDIYLSPTPKEYAYDIELKEKEIDSEKNTIFIVEDNIEMINFLFIELQKYYNVFFALNGKLALTKIIDIPKPDLIISDIMMDEMDGIEFFKNINMMEKYQDIPFIFLTVKSELEDKLSGLKAGAIDYIQKPFLMEELVLRINSIITNLRKQKIVNLELIEKSLDNTITSLKMKTDIEAVNKFRKFEKIYDKFNISYKEKMLLELVHQGYQNKEISSNLNVSVRTVENHLHHIYKKLNIKNRVELFNLLFK